MSDYKSVITRVPLQHLIDWLDRHPELENNEQYSDYSKEIMRRKNKMVDGKPANVPHIPTTAELVEEQLEDILTATLELLDERLFYVYDKYSDYNANEYSEFVARATENLDKRIVERVKEWDGNDNAASTD